MKAALWIPGLLLGLDILFILTINQRVNPGSYESGLRQLALGLVCGLPLLMAFMTLLGDPAVSSTVLRAN